MRSSVQPWPRSSGSGAPRQRSLTHNLEQSLGSDDDYLAQLPRDSRSRSRLTTYSTPAATAHAMILSSSVSRGTALGVAGVLTTIVTAVRRLSQNSTAIARV